MVKSLQSVLKLPFQPDEKAVEINQVFFADPSRPTSRVFVARLNPATIRVAVVALRSAGGVAAVVNTVPFPAVPDIDGVGAGLLPESPKTTIGDQIARVKSGKYIPFPAIQSTGGPVSSSGIGVFEVQNDTPYTLTALFRGPVEREV